ncbi:MAG: KpsF/GutQ family sugar-phosphate isomerase [Deltaproteobacteria bacterium]|nr:KpsF/GutQ family sugar-phosphate isomerase [Deltaproteobacteria bacterium]MBW1994976.1 KpsF/GutQ family sugar-phosphate isomerase [Deltaproteobacteria bacterium]MBW2152067.1 KpsF/GutQ family sugar-phosphate isomerase [Deltaproteobacteria bacterium]
MNDRVKALPQDEFESIIETAVDVLKLEAESILKLAQRVDSGFVDMVELICHSTGRVIVGGIGKSGIVGRKIVATLNSTGTRALFLHPVEAMHGDLGIVCPDDIFLALSNSGETEELNVLLPSIRNIGCKIIALTGNKDSTLARESDIVIDVGVEREACPLNLAPTASTTALLAMGDALAAVLIQKKKFDYSDFKKFHPGGTLGQRLSREVRDIMLTGNQVPSVYEDATLAEAIKEIDRLSFGVTFILSQDNDRLVGIITDGDLRRLLAQGKTIDSLTVSETMTRNPRRVGPQTPAYDALNLMEKYQITVLPITDSSGKVLGLLHLHDILGKGEFKFNGT